MARRDEDQIHRAIVSYLRVVLPDALLSHARNEGNRRGKAGVIDGARGKSLGVCPGYPDLVMYWQGEVIHWEIKTPKGRLSAAQKAVRDRIEREGHAYAVVRSIDDVKERLEVWGIASKGKAR